MQVKRFAYPAIEKGYADAERKAALRLERSVHRYRFLCALHGIYKIMAASHRYILLALGQGYHKCRNPLMWYKLTEYRLTPSVGIHPPRGRIIETLLHVMWLDHLTKSLLKQSPSERSGTSINSLTSSHKHCGIYSQVGNASEANQ